MNSRRLVTFALLVLLTTPLQPAHGGDCGGSPAAPIASTQDTTATQRRGPRLQQRRKRRPIATGDDAAAPTTLALTSEYLRCQLDGIEPSSNAQAAWDAFFRWCDGTIRQFAGRFSMRGADVDDCAQEVWSDLLCTLCDFHLDPARGRFSSWLYTVVRSKAMDLARRNVRRACTDLSGADAHLATRETDPAIACQRRSECELVRRALDQLRNGASDDSFRVLYLRQIEGCDVCEVAQALGMTPAQVWAREHRMKHKLRQRLESVWC